MRWDSVHDGRTSFLACMRATCSPGTPIELPAVPRVSDHAELDGAAAILLALLDRGLKLGVNGGHAARHVADKVLGETGATEGEVDEADWVLVHGPAADSIARARRGTSLAPELGATLVVAASGEPQPIWIEGPGVPERSTVWIPLDSVVVHAFTAANAMAPRGVDLLIATATCVIGLPRSVRVGIGGPGAPPAGSAGGEWSDRGTGAD